MHPVLSPGIVMRTSGVTSTLEFPNTTNTFVVGVVDTCKKNGLILPIRQWYAPSAVINDDKVSM